MELDHVRKASKMQAKYTDAKLQKLQAMLDATQKERDGAIKICNKLQQHLLNLSNNSIQSNRYISPTMHAVTLSSSWDDSIKNYSDNIPKTHIMHSAHTLSKQPTMASSELFEENNLATEALEEYGLPVFNENKAWAQKEASFGDSSELFSIDIFDKLDSLELPELPDEKNLVSEWEADLTKSWEASLSSPSSANSTAASQMLTKASADKCPSLSNSSTTGSPTTKMEANMLVGDPCSVGSQTPIATVRQGTPSSASSNMICLSAHTPITTQSMQANASPQTTPSSVSLSASGNVYNSSHLSKVSSSTPSTSASLSASPIASVSNHLSMSAKPSTSLMPVSATPSVHSLARRPDCLPMSAALNSSITCTSAPAPLPSALAIPMQMSQSLATPTFPHSGMIREATMPSSFTSSPNTSHTSPLSKCQSKPLFSTPLPHFSTASTRNTSSEIGQAASLVLPKKRRHLPEPPEANMDVMLSSLPKKGKLLEAVMKAGPLLQQLILAGPMPQWQQPPPQLKTANIPRIHTSPNSVLTPFLHVQYSPKLSQYAGQMPLSSTL